jgi:hypothetical protein
MLMDLGRAGLWREDVVGEMCTGSAGLWLRLKKASRQAASSAWKASRQAGKQAPRGGSEKAKRQEGRRDACPTRARSGDGFDAADLGDVVLEVAFDADLERHG